jgi:hypothetical protein
LKFENGETRGKNRFEKGVTRCKKQVPYPPSNHIPPTCLYSKGKHAARFPLWRERRAIVDGGELIPLCWDKGKQKDVTYGLFYKNVSYPLSNHIPPTCLCSNGKHATRFPLWRERGTIEDGGK